MHVKGVSTSSEAIWERMQEFEILIADLDVSGDAIDKVAVIESETKREMLKEKLGEVHALYKDILPQDDDDVKEMGQKERESSSETAIVYPNQMACIYHH